MENKNYNDKLKNDLHKVNEIKSDKEMDEYRRKGKHSRKDEEHHSKRNRDRSRDSRSKREEKFRESREKDRKERYNEKEHKHKRSNRSSSRSSDEKDSRKRSRSRHSRRNQDIHSSRHIKNRSRSRDHSKDFRREPKDDHTDPLDKKTQEILKNIEIPKEIRNKRDLVSKYKAEQLKIKAEEMAGVKIPTFYNTSNVNPLVLAEQQRKRKLLWSKSKDNENTSTKLVGKAIVQGQDEKTAEKFRKLMGIKSNDEPNDSTTTIHSMQQKAFDLMNKEYEYARVTTHLNRGKGLGFASHTANLLLDANQRLKFQ